jgi:hypothetical protein
VRRGAAQRFDADDPAHPHGDTHGLLGPVDERPGGVHDQIDGSAGVLFVSRG